jgi:hypothetical protein
LITKHRYANHRYCKKYGLHYAHKATVSYERLDIPVTCESTIIIYIVRVIKRDDGSVVLKIAYLQRRIIKI